VWIHDVFAFRAGPAAWKELLVWVTGAVAREPTAGEAKKLHRLGDDKVVAVLSSAGGGTIEIAARAEHRDAFLGPYAHTEAAPDEQELSLSHAGVAPQVGTHEP
jgi:hypothetical protein